MYLSIMHLVHMRAIALDSPFVYAKCVISHSSRKSLISQSSGFLLCDTTINFLRMLSFFLYLPYNLNYIADTSGNHEL